MTDAHPCDRPYRVGLYQSIPHGFVMVCAQYGEKLPTPSDCIRVSEMQEVRFVPLSTDEGVQAALQSLDAMEQEARAELTKRPAEINDQRASLRALTHQTEVA